MFQIDLLKSKTKKYFQYEDRLRRIVSKVTGFFILLYNFFSGWLIVFIFAKVILGYHKPGTAMLLFYILPAFITGFVILKFCIFLSDQIHRGTVIEDYSYLRLILFVTVIIYLILMIVFFIINLSAEVLRFI